jgi:MFS family permease
MEEIFNQIGAFGAFQKKRLFIGGLISSFTAITFFSNVFINAKPDLVCRLLENDSNKTIKINRINNKNESCEMYWKYVENSSSSLDYECGYESDFYGRTIINEFDLVCEKSFLAHLTESINLCGFVFSLILGFLSDKFGRKRVLMHACIALTLVLITNTLVQMNFMLEMSKMQRYTIYLVCRFFIGVLGNSVFIVMYVLLLELTNKEHSILFSNINLAMFVMGEFMALGIAYYLRDWIYFLYIMSAYSLICSFSIAFFMPESPSYLLDNDLVKKANKLIRKIASANGTSTNLSLKNEFDNSKSLLITKSAKTSIDDQNEANENINMLSFLSSGKNFLNFGLLCYVWFSSSIIYFGISLGVASVRNLNPYTSYFLSSAAEICGYMLCYFNDKFAQKRMFIIYFLIACLSCASVAFIPVTSSLDQLKTPPGLDLNSILILVFITISKTATSAVFNSAYIYTTCFYPTRIRSTMLALILSVGRTGGIIAPLFNFLSHFIWDPISYILFSFFAFLSIFCIIALPNPSKLDNF